jgi:hypothetical protein
MRIIDYDKQDKNTGNTEEHIATDAPIEKKFGNIQHAFEEGFAASDGVRGATAATDGRMPHPEKADDSKPKRVPDAIENENPGLADN